jgi:type I restriction enzyme S subunit
MHLLKHFKELTVRPKNAQELKGLILQLAVQGKLTDKWRSENPNMESAVRLLERINQQKDNLVNKKRIRIEKSKKEFSKNKVKFFLPEKWVSVNITEVYYLIGGKSNQIKSKNYNDFGKYPIVSQGKNKIDGYSDDFSKLLNIEKPVVVFGDHTRIIKYISFDFIIGADGTKILRPFDGVDTYFFYLQLQSYDLSNRGYARHYSLLKQEPFCLPPLEEQKVIVTIVETLFKEVEQLEQLTVERITLKEKFVTSALNQLTTNNAKNEWALLQEQFHSFFNETGNIKKLRETVLQLAVQGKLTADWRLQRSLSGAEVEDASILLKRIQKEKAQLIKDKKIKKEKPLPAITKDEVPYELPEGWVWCRLQDLVNVGTGSTPAKSNSNYYNGTIPWYTSSATNDLFAKEATKLITEKALQETNCKIFPKGTLIIAMYGQGKTRGQISELIIPGATNQAIAAMVFYENSVELKDYIKYFFRKIYEEIRLLAEGGAQPNLNVGKIKNTILPLPPLEEQKAIVEKVNALMDLCDALEQQVQQSREQSEQLMQSCLREVFEG